MNKHCGKGNKGQLNKITHPTAFHLTVINREKGGKLRKHAPTLLKVSLISADRTAVFYFFARRESLFLS